MIKKTALFAIFTLLISVGCGKGDKYGDVKDVMNATISINEAFVISMEKAKNGKDVAAGVNAYSESMEKLIPKMKIVKDTFKDMKAAKDGEKVPAELQELVKKTTEMHTKMASAYKVMTKYAADSEVKKAMTKFQTIMTKIQ